MLHNQFPSYRGKDLNGQNVLIPDALKGEYKALLISFHASQQSLVHSWDPFLQQLEQQVSSFYFYDLRIFSKVAKWRQWYIDINNRWPKTTREDLSKVMAVYLEKDRFFQLADITDEKEPVLFLLNRFGTVRTKITGSFDKEKGHQLLSYLPQSERENSASFDIEPLVPSC